MASPNKSRTRDAPTPTNISTKSEPDIEKNGTPASPATARASKVLPVPGGPTSNTPFGIRAPNSLNFLGSLRKSTISAISSFSSSAPATSAKVVLRLPSSLRTLALPKFMVLSPPIDAPIFLTKSTPSNIITPISKICGSIAIIQELSPPLI